MANSNSPQDILQLLGKKLGKSPESVAQSAKQGNISELLSGLDPDTQQKVRSILSDPDRTRKIMDNPQVQALIRRFTDNG